MTHWRKQLDIEKIKITRGDIHIIKERCKGCRFCVEYCPKDVLEMSEEYNLKGYHPPVAVNPDACLECHLCEMLCPEFAIYITIRDEQEVGNLAETKR